MIKCSRATLEEASCCGTFCDRQNLNLGPTQNCGCMYMSSNGVGDLVINVDITFNVDPSFHPEGEVTVPYF
jgi:hypothetical protein